MNKKYVLCHIDEPIEDTIEKVKENSKLLLSLEQARKELESSLSSGIELMIRELNIEQ